MYKQRTNGSNFTPTAQDTTKSMIKLNTHIYTTYHTDIVVSLVNYGQILSVKKLRIELFYLFLFSSLLSYSSSFLLFLQCFYISAWWTFETFVFVCSILWVSGQWVSHCVMGVRSYERTNEQTGMYEKVERKMIEWAQILHIVPSQA